MKIKNQIPMKNYRILICLGLFLISVCLVAKHFKPLPDFMLGYFMGTGIGLEVVGVINFIKMKRRNAGA